jgi:hypothetical protein
MKLRLTGTEAECARLVFLLRFGPPELNVVKVSQRYRSRHDPERIYVYIQVRFAEDLPPADRTFYSLIRPDGSGLLVDAWGQEVDA